MDLTGCSERLPLVQLCWPCGKPKTLASDPDGSTAHYYDAVPCISIYFGQNTYAYKCSSLALRKHVASLEATMSDTTSLLQALDRLTEPG